VPAFPRGGWFSQIKMVGVSELLFLPLSFLFTKIFRGYVSFKEWIATPRLNVNSRVILVVCNRYEWLESNFRIICKRVACFHSSLYNWISLLFWISFQSPTWRLMCVRVSSAFGRARPELMTSEFPRSAVFKILHPTSLLPITYLFLLVISRPIK
jgi:hypothetical protein